MDRRSYIINSRNARLAVANIVAGLERNWRVEIKAPRRSTDQNSLLWAWLTAFAEQAEWAGKKRDEYAWKDLFTAAVKIAAGEGRIEAVTGLEGGLMILGLHTSDMTKTEMNDLLTYMETKAAEWGVELPREIDSQEAGSAQQASRRAA